MARGINRVILIGNVGNDPEVRFMPSGDAVANFNLATSEAWKDKQTGEKKERTEWHRCNVFGRMAEIVQQYVKKGSKLYVEGSLHTRKWQDQNGQDRYSTEIKVRDMQMLDSAGGGQQQGQQGGYQNQQGAAPNNAAQANAYRDARNGNPPQQQNQGQYNAPDPGGFDDFNDEIPF